MSQYFIGRDRKSIIDILSTHSVEPVKFSYFVDEKIDSAYEMNHLVINNSTFSDIGFKNTKAHQCDFSFCTFIGCYFRGANFEQIKFQSCQFVDCKFEHATFIGCDFQYAEFEKCFIPYSIMKSNLPHERENINHTLCRSLSIQCLQLGAVEDYKLFMFEERKAAETHAIRKLFHSSNSYYSKYSFLEGIEGLLFYVRSKISKYLWGYGEKMGVLLRNILLVILGYALSYVPVANIIIENPISDKSILSALYLSACTFFSGNINLIQINSKLQILMLSEHILGAILVGFFGAALFRQINRR